MSHTFQTGHRSGSEPTPCLKNAEVIRGGPLYLSGKRVAAFLATIWVVSCYFFSGVNPALSEEIKAQLKTGVDATQVTIGDVVTVNLSVKHSPTVKVAFPQVETTLGMWTVRNSKRLAQTKLTDGTVEDNLQLQLAAYRTGDLEIPGLSVETVKPNGEKEVLASEPIKVAIQSVLTGNQDALKDLKPQAEIEADYKPFLFFLAALASAGYLVYRLIQYLKGRNKGPIPKPERVRSPEEIANEAIERLLARRLVEQGQFKQFYLELSEIVKRFLGSKLGVHSLERTTEEFTRDLRAVSVPSAQYRLIREFLEDCDLVKFAKYRPAADEVEQIIARSRAMIARMDMNESSAKPQTVEVAP